MATIDPKTMERTAAGTRALDVIVRAGVPHTRPRVPSPRSAHGRDRDRRPSYGVDAADALGIDPARVFKTLAVSVDGRLVLAVIPVDRELDLKRLADAVGGRRATMADPAEAERATGYVVGGISPLGTRRTLPLIVDERAARARDGPRLRRPARAPGRAGTGRSGASRQRAMGPRHAGRRAGLTRPSLGWHTGRAPRQHRRQAQTEERRPHGRTCHRVGPQPDQPRIVSAGSNPSVSSRPRAPSDHDLTPPIRRRRRHHPPSPRAHRVVFRRTGGKDLASSRTRRPAGVVQAAGPAGRSRDRDRTRHIRRDGRPGPRRRRRGSRSSSSSARSVRAPRTTSTTRRSTRPRRAPTAPRWSRSTARTRRGPGSRRRPRARRS